MSESRYPFLQLSKVNAPYIEEIQKAVARVIASGRYIGGSEVERFESSLSSMIGVDHVVGVSNGLDALRLMLRAYVIKGDLQPGDEVIVPANTYVASVLAIIDAGLIPVLAEPSSETLNLDTTRLSEYLSPRTRAIMVVHLYGRVCWDDSLTQFARQHGLLVVEDNAQAIGAKASCNGFSSSRFTGALGHAAAFSFYPTKNIGAMGDAGAVSTNDPQVATIVRALANYGTDRRYHNIYAGYNCRLDPVQAAVLNVKLPFTAHENALRRDIARIYNASITNPLVTLPRFVDSDECVWHQYVVSTTRRDEFRQYLSKNGVETDIHYAVPPHRQPCFSNSAHRELPVTERLAETIVSLPVSRCTTPDDARVIAEIINAYQG